jgi:hypothetical protein
MTTAMIGQTQSCFFNSSRVRDSELPIEVWANVMCACCGAPTERER